MAKSLCGSYRVWGRASRGRSASRLPCHSIVHSITLKAIAVLLLAGIFQRWRVASRKRWCHRCRRPTSMGRPPRSSRVLRVCIKHPAAPATKSSNHCRPWHKRARRRVGFLLSRRGRGNGSSSITARHPAAGLPHLMSSIRAKGWDELGYDFVIGNGTDTGDGQIEVGFAALAQAEDWQQSHQDAGQSVQRIRHRDLRWWVTSRAGTRPTANQMRHPWRN